MADTPEQPQNDFQKQVAKGRDGLVKEFTALLMEKKKWWFAPIIGLIVLIGLLVLLGGTATAPFLYTFF